jgi:hypothetical protein
MSINNRQVSDQIVNAKHLWTKTEYARKLGITAPSVDARVLRGTLKSVQINGSSLVVDESS